MISLERKKKLENVVKDNCWIELIINKKKKQQKQMAYLGTRDLIRH